MHCHDCAVRATLICVAMLSVMAPSTHASLTFTNFTTANGLGSNYVYGVYESGGTIYPATAGGLSLTRFGGQSFGEDARLGGSAHGIEFRIVQPASTPDLYRVVQGRSRSLVQAR